MPPIVVAEIVSPGADQAVAILLLLAMVGALLFWTMVFRQHEEGRAILPMETRTPVPWGGGDVLAVLAAKLIITALVVAVIHWWFGLDLGEQPVASEDAPPEVAHAVLQAMASGGPWVLLLCVVSAVVVAPIAEEFLFRVLLQGWLEAGLDRAKGYMPALQRLSRGGVGPILVSSLVFAAVHFRTAGPPRPNEWLVAALLGNAVIWLLTLAFALTWLHFRTGATATDLGLVARKMPGDAKLGLWTLAGVLGPIYVIQIACYLALPAHIAPDPVPLFFLAIALGVLYARTHRLMACVALHALFNAASLATAWMAMGGF